MTVCISINCPAVNNAEILTVKFIHSALYLANRNSVMICELLH